MSIIADIHPHIASTDTVKYPITPIGGTRSDWSHERAVTMEEMVSAMDEAGVDLCAMVHSSTTYGFNCEYCADAVAKYPNRMTGVFSINVLEPDNAQKMRLWYSKGLTGMRIFSRGSTLKDAWLKLNDPRVFPCYETGAELGISIATNTTVEVFDQFEEVIKQFPKTNFILDHLGKTDFTDGAPFNNAKPLWNLAKYPNFYLKIASRNFGDWNKGKSTSETLFKKLCEVFGSHRMAWGSNYPASEGSLKELKEMAQRTIASLPQKDQDNIMGGTALHLYPALAKLAKKAAY